MHVQVQSQAPAQSPIEFSEQVVIPPIEVTDTGQVLPLPGQQRRGLTAPVWVRAVLRNRKAAVGVVILLLFAVVALLAVLLLGQAVVGAFQDHHARLAAHVLRA